MGQRTDKNQLKQYFRSGSRPTQKQFHELIDNCYNEDISAYVSGYDVIIDAAAERTVYKLSRESGKTLLIPYFDHINLIHKRVFHYALPACNVSSGYVLEKVTIDVSLPVNSVYKVKDKDKQVDIEQKIIIDAIRVYNGDEEIYAVSSNVSLATPIHEISLDKSAKIWQGIGIDIAVSYNIRTKIAVSDQLNIAAESQNMLLHTFGAVGCTFKPADQ